MSGLLVLDLPLEQVFARFSDLLAASVKVSAIEVAVRDGSTWIRLRYSRNRVTRLESPTLPYNGATVATVAFGRTMVEEDPARFSMPLAIGDEIVGAVAIRSDAIGAYDDADATVVQSLAPYLAVAIRQRILRHTVERERFRAEHDALTGIANRTLLAKSLEEALAHSRRAGERVALLFLDLDGFKTINDRYGHDAGDLVLRLVARRLAHGIRQSDVAARMGGDEFAVLLPKMPNDAVLHAVAEKIRAALEKPMRWNQRRLDIGVSVGAALAVAGSDAQGLLQEADDLMYADKHGRARREAPY
jgi:diguanylate cyclase (GGDEF)-like protein